MNIIILGILFGGRFKKSSRLIKRLFYFYGNFKGGRVVEDFRENYIEGLDGKICFEDGSYLLSL